MPHSPLLKNRLGTSSVIALAAAGVSLPLLLYLRNLPLSFFALWEWILQMDLGNAIAALVAVAGYMIEHWNSRRSQRLDAQIQRVLAQSHDLLVPITTHMQALCIGSLRQFVDSHLDDAKDYIVTEYGDDKIGEKLLEEFSKPPRFSYPTDAQHPESGMFFWMKDVTRKPSTSSPTGFHSAVTARTELPRFLHRAIEDCDKPDSYLWRSYEAFVRCELLPSVDRIAEIINKSGHLMERVPPERLKEMFGPQGTGFGMAWEIAPRMFFYSMWLAYAKSWHTLIHMWDSGYYKEIRPSAPFPIGLLFFNIEAQTIVADVEKELVGMSQMHGSAIARK